jgi:hypothetical protein
MAWMHDILRPFIDKFVVCCLDGILTAASRTPAEHMTHGEQVFQALQQGAAESQQMTHCHLTYY